MIATTFAYRFVDRVSTADIEGTLVLACLAAEGLFGEARVRLEAPNRIDRANGYCQIDARGPAGHAVSRIFTAFVTREFGPDAFRVEHVQKRRMPKRNQATVTNGV